MLKYLYEKQQQKLVLFVIFSLLSSLFEIALAYVMLQAVNFAIEGNLSDATRYAILFAAYIFCFFLVDLIYRRLRWVVLRGSQTNLRDDLTRHILSQPITAFHLQNTGNWLSILTNDLEMVEESYFRACMETFTDLFSGLVSLVLLLWISPWLALFILLMIGIQMLVPKYMAPLIAKKKTVQSKSAEFFTTTVNEHLNGFDLLRSFHLTDASRQAISDANKKWEDSKFQSRFFSSLARLLSFTVGQVIYVGIYFFGAILTLQGLMSVGMMVAASQLVVYIASPIQNISDAITDIRSAQDIIKKFHQILDQVNSSNGGELDVPKEYSTFAVNDVSFSYDEDHPILINTNFTLKRGGKYLLEGDSGSGKTTLINLLTGALHPEEGQIMLDGQPIEMYHTEQYARFLIPCSQQTFIFNASIRNNITLFQEGFTDDDVYVALEAVGFEHIIKRYPDGLEHIIDQSGSSLSGGERQRLALARIFLFKPQIVIYDESFAHLDSTSVDSLIRTIVADPERTIVLTSHQATPVIRKQFQTLLLRDGTVYQ